MLWLIFVFTFLHIVCYIKLAFGWRKVQLVSGTSKLVKCSVVIPVRNEESNMVRILGLLEEQDFPRDHFEVIVIDDFSEDNTAQEVKKFMASSKIQIELIQLEDTEKQGKKHALTAAVSAAKYDVIITTDADCWFGKNWIGAYSNAFDDSINMIAGPVAIEGSGFFARLQQVEFAGLMGFGAVTIAHENPSMCSGANLGFRKQAFEAVGGYTNNLFTPSGDDEFLLFNIMRKFPRTTHFLKNENAIVKTSAHSKLRSFINQRTRWTSKWKHNKNWKVRASAILFFMDYLIFYLAIALAAVGMIQPLPVGLIVLARLLSSYVFVAPINNFLKGKAIFWPLVAFQIIYPMHVLFMGLNSIFGSYTWKGRKYG